MEKGHPSFPVSVARFNKENIGRADKFSLQITISIFSVSMPYSIFLIWVYLY